MLCFDDISVKYIHKLNLNYVTIIPQKLFEAGDELLVETKKDRTRLEYYYTCGPSLLLYVLNHYPEVDIITYLDSDLFFFNDPYPLIQEIDGYSIGMTVHNFPEYKSAPKTGKYNVGWLSFRRDVNGIACLKWWRDKCINWCYEFFEDDKYADQMYLDEWPKLFHGVKILEHKGANVASWNVSDYNIYKQDCKVVVSGYSLIFYHFHGFKQLSRHIYNTNLGLTFKFPSKIIKERIFLPYIIALNKNKLTKSLTLSIRKKKLRPQWIQIIRTFLRTIIGIIFRQYVIVIGDHIY